MYSILPQGVTGEREEEHEEGPVRRLDWDDYDIIVEKSELSAEAMFVSTERCGNVVF